MRGCWLPCVLVACSSTAGSAPPPPPPAPAPAPAPASSPASADAKLVVTYHGHRSELRHTLIAQRWDDSVEVLLTEDAVTCDEIPRIDSRTWWPRPSARVRLELVQRLDPTGHRRWVLHSAEVARGGSATSTTSGRAELSLGFDGVLREETPITVLVRGKDIELEDSFTARLCPRPPSPTQDSAMVVAGETFGIGAANLYRDGDDVRLDLVHGAVPCAPTFMDDEATGLRLQARWKGAIPSQSSGADAIVATPALQGSFLAGYPVGGARDAALPEVHISDAGSFIGPTDRRQLRVQVHGVIAPYRIDVDTQVAVRECAAIIPPGTTGDAETTVEVRTE